MMMEEELLVMEKALQRLMTTFPPCTSALIKLSSLGSGMVYKELPAVLRVLILAATRGGAWI